MLGLTDVDHHLFGADVTTNDLTGIDFVARLDNKITTLLQLDQRIRGDHARFQRHQLALLGVVDLASKGLIAVEKGVIDTRAACRR